MSGIVFALLGVAVAVILAGMGSAYSYIWQHAFRSAWLVWYRRDIREERRLLPSVS